MWFFFVSMWFIIVSLWLIICFNVVHHCSNVVYRCFSADDHTRVTLAEVEGFPGSDYINANFIDVSMEFFCK